MEKLIMSYAPHIRTDRTTKNLMTDVVIALLPSLAAGIYFFGIRVLIHTLTAVIACVLSEYLFERIFKMKSTVRDMSACVTGILIAYNLPVSAPFWMDIVGGVFAIVIVKMFFGGLGHNFVNPALAARAFLLACWPTFMTEFVMPGAGGGLTGIVSSATPLVALKEGTNFAVSILDLFLGNVPGCMGEVSALAILIGFAYLLIRKVIDWKVPVIYVGVVFVLSYAAGLDPVRSILSGGLLLGAVFMATDYVTSPMADLGRVIYAVGLGVLTFVIRYFGRLPEGVSYSILIMNIVTPLIDKFVKNRRYGA